MRDFADRSDGEDMGLGGPQGMMGSLSPWGRFWDVIGYTFGPLICKNPNRTVDKVVKGMASRQVTNCWMFVLMSTGCAIETVGVQSVRAVPKTDLGAGP